MDKQDIINYLKKSGANYLKAISISKVEQLYLFTMFEILAVITDKNFLTEDMNKVSRPLKNIGLKFLLIIGGVAITALYLAYKPVELLGILGLSTYHYLAVIFYSGINRTQKAQLHSEKLKNTTISPFMLYVIALSFALIILNSLLTLKNSFQSFFTGKAPENALPFNLIDLHTLFKALGDNQENLIKLSADLSRQLKSNEGSSSTFTMLADLLVPYFLTSSYFKKSNPQDSEPSAAEKALTAWKVSRGDEDNLIKSLNILRENLTPELTEKIADMLFNVFFDISPTSEKTAKQFKSEILVVLNALLRQDNKLYDDIVSGIEGNPQEGRPKSPGKKAFFIMLKTLRSIKPDGILAKRIAQLIDTKAKTNALTTTISKAFEYYVKEPTPTQDILFHTSIALSNFSEKDLNILKEELNKLKNQKYNSLLLKIKDVSHNELKTLHFTNEEIKSLTLCLENKEELCKKLVQPQIAILLEATCKFITDNKLTPKNTSKHQRAFMESIVQCLKDHETNDLIELALEFVYPHIHQQDEGEKLIRTLTDVLKSIKDMDPKKAAELILAALKYEEEEVSAIAAKHDLISEFMSECRKAKKGFKLGAAALNTKWLPELIKLKEDIQALSKFAEKESFLSYLSTDTTAMNFVTLIGAWGISLTREQVCNELSTEHRMILNGIFFLNPEDQETVKEFVKQKITTTEGQTSQEKSSEILNKIQSLSNKLPINQTGALDIEFISKMRTSLSPKKKSSGYERFQRFRRLLTKSKSRPKTPLTISTNPQTSGRPELEIEVPSSALEQQSQSQKNTGTPLLFNKTGSNSLREITNVFNKFFGKG